MAEVLRLEDALRFVDEDLRFEEVLREEEDLRFELAFHPRFAVERRVELALRVVVFLPPDLAKDLKAEAVPRLPLQMDGLAFLIPISTAL